MASENNTTPSQNRWLSRYEITLFCGGLMRCSNDEKWLSFLDNSVLLWDGEIRDKRGTLKWASSAIATEAIACLKGIQWANQRGLCNVDIHTDSTSLIGMLNSPSTCDISIHHTLRKIRVLGRGFPGGKVTKVGRENVRAAHEWANDFRKARNFLVFFSDFPFLVLFRDVKRKIIVSIFFIVSICYN